MGQKRANSYFFKTLNNPYRTVGVFAAVAIAVALTIGVPPAKAVSDACALVDGKTGSNTFLGLLFSPGETFTFNPGEAITVKHTKTTGPSPGSLNTMEIRTVQNTSIITAQALTRFEDALGSTGTITWNIDSAITIEQLSVGDNSFTDTFSFEVSCTARVGQSTANASAKAALSQTAGLVTQRLRRIAQNDSKASALRSQTAQVEGSGLIDLSVGRDGAISLDGPDNGAAAGYTPSPWGVWANFAWSGINDTTTVAGTQGNVVTGIAGADYEVSDGFIVGGAISIGGAAFDSQIAAFDTDETSIGFNPYLAFQVTDLLSLDAILGYSIGVGESTRAETITGHYGIHRYYAAGNASYFQTWDRLSMLASLGVLWGQSLEAAYTESDGTEIDSRRSDLGSVSLLMQPAYLFDLDADNGWYLEPYLVGAYSYDFTISKITGHNNDRDEFRLGLGMNLFAGDSLSGNLEATTTVGREDQRTVSILGTIRYDF